MKKRHMNFKKYYNQGQSLLAIIMWAGGISLSFVGGSYAVISGKFTNVNADIKENAVKTAIVQQKTEDIDQRLTRIENKLDLILTKVK